MGGGTTSASAASASASSTAGAAPLLMSLIDEREFGRAVTGTLRLVHSGCLNAPESSPSLPLASDADASTNDASRFLTALQSGNIAQTGRYDGSKLLPRVFLHPSASEAFEDSISGPPGGGFPAAATAVPTSPATAVRFHPHPAVPAVFLAGFADGSVAVYSTDHSLPLASWTFGGAGASGLGGGAPVTFVSWLLHRPAAFLAVDAQGTCGVWDLGASTSGPVHVASLAAGADKALAGSGAGGRMFAAAFSTGGHALEPANVSVVAALSPDRVSVLTLSPSFCVPDSSGEAERMAGVLARLR